MPRSKMQSGYIELEGKSYIFIYDGELLQLVPKEQSSIKPYDFLANKNIHLEVLEDKRSYFAEKAGIENLLQERMENQKETSEDYKGR